MMSRQMWMASRARTSRLQLSANIAPSGCVAKEGRVSIAEVRDRVIVVEAA